MTSDGRATTATTPARGHRDESLSLLWRIVDDAVDPGYAAAADRARSSNKRGVGLGHSVALAVALLILAALVTAAYLQTQRGAPSADRTRTDLTKRVVAATEQMDALAARVDILTQRTADLRAAALSGTTADQALADRVAALETGVGARAVAGPGIEVVLDDGPPTSASGEEPDLARVLDRDLQVAVNGLLAAGAEAVSVNGQRITSLSAIRGAGGAVLVGYRPLSPPYIVAAIGSPDSLESNFTGSTAADQLRALSDAYGIVFEVEAAEDLLVPGQPDLALRYAALGGGA
jgi:uncharacterized protein YlxW (UPF0749 family)